MGIKHSILGSSRTINYFWIMTVCLPVVDGTDLDVGICLFLWESVSMICGKWTRNLMVVSLVLWEFERWLVLMSHPKTVQVLFIFF